jgi:hypothetical protein
MGLFAAFDGITNKIEVLTDLRLLLDDPAGPDRRFTRMLETKLEGEMMVEIGRDFLDASGLSVLPWRVVSMEQSGQSNLGPIRAHNNPTITTYGTVRQRFQSSPFPAELEASVVQDIEVPGYGTLTIATPVWIGAEIEAIPPLGVVVRHKNAGMLIDDKRVARGMVDGRSITLVRSLP